MKFNILIADDDHDFVSVLSDFLAVNGYQTCCAYDGLSTVEMAIKKKPDLVLLDWKMPKGTGAGVIEMLANGKETKKIPVVVISAVTDEAMKKTALAMGARAVFIKPHDETKLLQTIKNVLTSQS